MRQKYPLDELGTVAALPHLHKSRHRLRFDGEDSAGIRDAASGMI